MIILKEFFILVNIFNVTFSLFTLINLELREYRLYMEMKDYDIFLYQSNNLPISHKKKIQKLNEDRLSLVKDMFLSKSVLCANMSLSIWILYLNYKARKY